MKAHIADDKWAKAEKAMADELQKWQHIGFAEGMKANAKIINKKLNDHTRAMDERLKDIQSHLDWCMGLKKEK